MSASPLLSLDDVLLMTHGPGIELGVIRGARVALFGDDSNLLSRLLDTISGHIAPTRGRILLDGRDITELPPEQRPIGLLSTRDPLFKHFDVRGNVAFPSRASGGAPSDISARTARFLALTRLDAIAEKRVQDLSAEENFRTQLARLLAYGPDILLLDDPLAEMDAATRRRCLALLATLGRALDLTMIYATTQREDALRFGQKIAVIAGASVLQCDTAPNLLDRPGDARVATLFGEANALAGRVLSIGNDIADIRLASGANVEAVATHGLTEDALCTVCIRPDRIAPHFGALLPHDGGDDERPLVATLQDVLHLGDHMRMRLRLEDSTEIEVRRPPLQNLRGVVPGVRVQLAWGPGQAVAFPLAEDSY